MVSFHPNILPKFFKEDFLVQAIFSITVFLIVLISPTGSLWGAEFCVDDATALQTALSTAASNDEDNIIQIARGITYVGNFFYATDKGKEIIIRGGYDKSGLVCTFPTTPSSPSETILDGNGAGRVLRVSDDGDGNIVVERLNLRNGNSTGDGGGLLASSSASGDSGDVRISYNIIGNNLANRMGGAWIDSYSSSGNSGSVRVTDNIIRNNSAINDYGGINARSESALNQSSTVTISDNIITNNTATNGFSGGVCAHSEGDTGSGTVTLSHNTITSNSSEGFGGGAYIYSRTISGPSGGIFLTNNMVAENNSNDYGGGLEVFCSGSPGTGGITLTNNTVAANSADVSSGGARLYGPGLSGTLNVYNNIFWGNTAPTGRDQEFYLTDGNPQPCYTRKHTDLPSFQATPVTECPALYPEF